MWPCKQGSDSNSSSEFDTRLSSPILKNNQLNTSPTLAWPYRQPSDLGFELKIWWETQHPHTHELEFQPNSSSGWTMWPCKQAIDSNFELSIWSKISKHSLHRPDHVALQASYRLEFWAYTLMQDTTSSYSRKKHSTMVNGQAWPRGLASKLQIESSSMMLPPGEGLWAPRGEKCIKKKKPTAGP
jgi:hypothetical protein